MPLWTDYVDPSELTGYARASLEDYEQAQGSLSRWLPNQTVADIAVRYVAGSVAGLIDVANFRSYDAEPELGKLPGGRRVTIEMPAVGQNIPVSEYNQLRVRNSNPSEDMVRSTIFNAADAVSRAVSNSVEKLRGTVLQTGKATWTQNGATFMDDDFGRSGTHAVTAGTLFSTISADALGFLTTWTDTYTADNGAPPGAILTSTRVLRAMGALTQFATVLVGGGTRPATVADVQATAAGAGLPPIYTYDRRVSVGGVAAKVLTDNRLFLLPAPGESQLGATFWGQTLTSQDSEYGLSGEEPGLVVGAYRGEKPPMIAEVISDAIALPVLANPDLSFVATVL